jgi:hypothetical protein
MARRERRVAVLNNLHEKLIQVISERSEGPGLAGRGRSDHKKQKQTRRAARGNLTGGGDGSYDDGSNDGGGGGGGAGEGGGTTSYRPSMARPMERTTN